jgi:hypothetical protein
MTTPRPYFLKKFATVLTNPDGLRDTGAHPENTLVVDDSPHKNVRNNIWNAVHPTVFIGSHPLRSLRYLECELMPWLRRMKESGQTTQDLDPRTCRRETQRSWRWHMRSCRRKWYFVLEPRFQSPILPLQSAGRREIEL